MDKLRFEITEELEDERIDKCLSALIDSLSRSFIQKMIRDGAVSVNGQSVKGSYRVKAEDWVEFCLPTAVEPDIVPEDIPLDILYEDEDVIVINKPKGMVVHPAAGHYSKTLVNALLYHCGESLSGINGVLRPGIVHRIDMDTTGSVIACKNDMAHNCIAEQLREHSMQINPADISLETNLRFPISEVLFHRRYESLYNIRMHPKTDGYSIITSADSLWSCPLPALSP